MRVRNLEVWDENIRGWRHWSHWQEIGIAFGTGGSFRHWDDAFRLLRPAAFALPARSLPLSTLLNAAAVAAAVERARPEVIIHELTAIPPDLDLRKFEEQFRLTNRLRTEGTDYLLAAARSAGVRRFIAQSYAGWPYVRSGGPVKTEDDPLDPNPSAGFRDTIQRVEIPGVRRPRSPGNGGYCLAVWGILRTRERNRRGRYPRGADSPPPHSDHRRRNRHMVFHPH